MFIQKSTQVPFCPGLIYVAVTKHPNKKNNHNNKGKRVCFSSQFQVISITVRKARREPAAATGQREISACMLHLLSSPEHLEHLLSSHRTCLAHIHTCLAHIHTCSAHTCTCSVHLYTCSDHFLHSFSEPRS